MSSKLDPALFERMARQTLDYAMFLMDKEGNVLSWNAGARRIKGYEEREVLGRHFSLFYTAEDIKRKWPAFELKQATMEGRFEDEGWRVKKDGSRFWANVIITALRDESGNLLAFSKITRDLSERKRAEEELRQSEERFRLLVEGVSDYAIYLLTPEGTVSSWNLGARRIKGYEASEIIGQHFSRFYDERSIEEGKPWLELAMAREHGRAEDEGWRVRKDGTRFWARVVVTALHDGNGRLQGFAKVTQDMTQRRHSDALEEAAKQINDFIAVLAHELRNPLAPIRNAVQLMKMTPAGEPLNDTVGKIIDRQSEQLSRIVDDLLDVSRITRGTLEMKKQRIPLADVITRAVESAKPGIDAGEHRLELEMPETEIFVEGDELRLTQALSNILNNAARYGEKGGLISLRLHSTAGGTHRTACITVRDTGFGIDPALLGSIFGMFVQGRDPLRKASSGLGIGLALARSIVELHHGTLEARSEGSGKGSEFILQLPQAEPQPAGYLPRVDQARKPAIAADLPRLRILVVDDNVDAATVLSGVLRKHGHEVHTVHGGSDALVAFEGFRPDIVLLDIGMPGMNGLEVARRLRERKRSPRPLIVAVTGWGQEQDEIQSREAGFDVHLVKPVEEQQILNLLAGKSRMLH